MTAIKLCALERLGVAIEREVPALRGRVCTGPANRNHNREFPHLAIIPESFKFLPLDGDAVDPRTGLVREPTPGTVIEQVGEWIGTIRLELGAANSAQRAQLEDLIERAFLSGSGSTVDPLYPDRAKHMRAGVILIDAPDCYGARMAFLIDEDSWSQEMVFSDEWYSIIRIDAELPALVPRYGVTPMTDVRIYLTESMETQVAGQPLPADTEKVKINPDGTVTVLP